MAERYFIKGEDFEIGPFSSKAAAQTEARALRDDEGIGGLKIRTETVSASPKKTTRKTDSKGSKKSSRDEEDLDLDDEEEDEDDDEDFDLDSLFDEDDDDDEDIEDEEEEDEDDDEDIEDDDSPKVTHPFFRKLGG